MQRGLGRREGGREGSFLIFYGAAVFEVVMRWYVLDIGKGMGFQQMITFSVGEWRRVYIFMPELKALGWGKVLQLVTTCIQGPYARRRLWPAHKSLCHCPL